MVAQLEVWKPQIGNVDSDGDLQVGFVPAYWVLCDSHRDSTLNQRAGNPIMDISIEDKWLEIRRAKLQISNPIPNFQADEDETYTHTWRDNRGVVIPSQPQSNVTRLRKTWGIYSYFFQKFQKVRLVDSVNHLVLFAGYIEDIVESMADSSGTTFELTFKDEIEELTHTDLEGHWKTEYKKDGGALVYRHEIIQHLLRTGMDPDVDRPEGFPWVGMVDRKQESPTLTVVTGNKANGEAFPIVNNNNATLVNQNHYKRFEFSQAPLQDLDDAPITVTWEPSKSGYIGVIGELGELAKSDPHHPLPDSDSENVMADSGSGYSFFLDPNYAVNTNLQSSTAPPSPMFNYFRDGGRLAEIDGGNGVGRQTAVTRGLTLKFTTRAGTERTHRQGKTATRFMDRQSIFDNAAENMFTTVALKYDGRGDVKSADESDGEGAIKDRSVAKVKAFEVIYCNQFNHASRQIARFLYGGKNFDDEGAKADQGVAGTDSAEKIDFYHSVNGGGIAGSATSAGVARVQMQYMDIGEILTANETNKLKAAYDAVLLSDITADFPTSSDMNSDDITNGYVYLKGATSGTYCRFNPREPADPKKGRPATVWSKQATRNHIVTGKIDQNNIRIDLINMLDQAATPTVYGDFMAPKAPYYYLDGTVRTASNVGDGQEITIKPTDTATGTLLVSSFGFREGMVALKMDPTVDDGWTKVAQSSGQDLYGYCYNMSNSTTFKINLTENQTFTASTSAGAGDHIRLVIPIRAGERVHIENVLGDYNAEVVVLATDYTERPYPLTEWKTQGSLETRRSQYTVKRRPNSAQSSMLGGLLSGKLPGSTDRSLLTVVKDFVMTYVTGGVNITWPAGTITASDGSVYKTAAGSTNNANFGLNGNLSGSTKYVLYLDPETDLVAGTSSSDELNIYTKSVADWKRDSSMIVLGSTQAGDADTLASLYDGAQVDPQGEPGKVAAPNLIHGGTITGNLIVDGTVTAAKMATGALQVGTEVTWVIGGGATPDMAFIPKTDTPAFNVQWDAGTIIHNPGISSATTYSIVAGNSAYTAHHTTTFYGYIDPSVSTTVIQLTENPYTWFDPDNIRLFSAIPSTAEETEVGISILQANNQSITLGNGVLRAGMVTADVLHGDAVNGKTITLDTGGKFITNAGTSRAGNYNYFSGNGSGILIDERGILGATGGGSANVEFYLDATGGGKCYFGGFDSTNAPRCTIGKGGLILGNNSGGDSSPNQATWLKLNGKTANEGSYSLANYDGAFYIFASNNTSNFHEVTFNHPNNASGATSDMWRFADYGTPMGWIWQHTGVFKELESAGHPARATNSSGQAVSGVGQVYTIQGDDGLWWKYENDTPIDLTGGGSGTLTSVTAGNGLTGGGTGTSGVVNLDLGAPGDLNGSTSSGASADSHTHAITSYSTLVGGSSADAQSLHDHADKSETNHTHSGGSVNGSGTSLRLARWSDTNTIGSGNWLDTGTLYPASGTGQNIGTPNNGINYLLFRNSYGIKTIYGSTATVIWETHGHHEFQSDVYIKAGSDLRCEDNFRVDDKCVVISLYGSGSTDVARNSNSELAILSSTTRIKQGIRPLEIDTSKIWDLDVKSYELKKYKVKENTLHVSDEIDKTDFGLIAEELHEVLPEIVTLDDEGLPFSILNKNLIMVVLAEMKKLRARVATLEGV